MNTNRRIAKLRSLARDAVVLGFSEKVKTDIWNQIKVAESEQMNEARALVNITALISSAHTELNQKSDIKY